MESDLEPLLQSAFRYALALTHDAAEAQDLAHDACLSVLRAGGPWHTACFLRFRGRPRSFRSSRREPSPK